jgi:DNA-binding Lrp family transcriptional regulator
MPNYSREYNRNSRNAKKVPAMITAIVLINAETDKINTLATQLVDIDGVQEVYSVAGRYDLAVIVRVAENDKLAEVISDKARHLDGILSSETLIAFRTFSQEQQKFGSTLFMD